MKLETIAPGSAEARSRRQRLAELKASPSPTVLIIGGGINGIGTFRDLALQGVNVVLVEKGDFCGGASGAPSRMIHGGLRYLENGEFTLVRESVQERNRLLNNAPHYVAPLRTTVPIFHYTSGLLGAVARFLGRPTKSVPRGAAIVKIGLSFYDLFTRGQRLMPRHSFAGRGKTRERWPHLSNQVKCTATYYDAWITYPERLGMELVKDIHEECPKASALNYVSADIGERGEITLHDDMTGESIAVTPRYVINAGGAWVDQINSRLDAMGKLPRLVGGTKGSHLIVRNKELLNELGEEMIYYENQEGRICILFPYFGNVLIGSTDIRVDDPDSVRCEADEQAYILESLKSVFPNICVAPDEIIYTYSGVRPLPFTGGGVTGRISRDHSIQTLPATEERPYPIICLVGGKWTTFRAFGEQTTDHVLNQLGAVRKTSTRDLPIGGGRAFPKTEAARRWIAEVAAETTVSAARIDTLLSRYGTVARQVAAFIAADADRALTSCPDYSEREIIYLARYEDALRPDDILLRRTAIAISGGLSLNVVVEVAGILAHEHAWSHSKRLAMIDETLALLSAKNGFIPQDQTTRTKKETA